MTEGELNTQDRTPGPGSYGTEVRAQASGRVVLPPPEGGRPDLLIVAGEHSGDQHAAVAVAALRERRPDLRIAAMGGPALKAAGAQLLCDMTETAVVGLVEVVRNLSYWAELYKRTVEWIEEHRPRAVCLVDYPGFNLRLARRLQESGISRKGGGGMQVVYYISPQIWAWKGKRRFRMAKTLDSLAVIFPFEVGVYGDTDLPVEFVGHPFLSSCHRLSVDYDPNGPLLLLPGSRAVPVKRIFPVLLGAFARARKNFPDLRAAVLYPDDRIRTVLMAELASFPEVAEFVELRDKDEGGGGRAVLTSSGTMSLTCALAGIPGAVAYKANWATYLIGRSLVKVPYLGICNILLSREMYPEFIQGRATAERLEAELCACLESPERLERTRHDSADLRKLLSAPGRQSVDRWLEKAVG